MTDREDRSSSAASPAPVLEVLGVHKQFLGVTALENVSFELRPGEVHALVGENGAGKSTLIKVLTGVHAPDAGEIRLGGKPVTFGRPADAQNAGISTIYQEVNLVPLLSVARNIFLGREPKRWGLIDFGAMNRQATALLQDYGIEVDVTKPLGSLGLGIQQMVALARAASVEAKVVIMDEPTSSLEQREVDTLFRVIRLLHDRGVSVVYVSHRMDELYAVCDRVTVLRDGRHVHTGPLRDLDRLRLVSLMLGRDLDAVRDGVTEFGDSHAMASEPVLVVTGLSARHQLDNVSLSVRPGEVVGLGGLLGSGRTETVRAIAGTLPLDGGQVRVKGSRVKVGGRSAGAALRAGIALLPEDRKAEGIVANLSVRENIVLAALPRLSRGGLVSRAQQDRLVETFMTQLRIKASSPEQKVSELSGGNQQKVVLARALATDPTVLLLDEPTRGIDVGAKAEVQALIDDLAAQGLAVVLISSEIGELVEGSDRIVVLREGSVAGELEGSAVTEEELMTLLAVGGEGS